MLKPNPKRYILINRVFSGTYLSDHVGHELINFIADDYGRQWCFVNKDGTMPFERYNKVDWIINCILVRRGVFEVLNAFFVQGSHIEFSEQAWRDKRIFHYQEQNEYLKRANVRYGGALVSDIYNDGAIVTYVARQVLLPKKRILLTHLNLTGDPLEGDAVRLIMEEGEKELGNQSPRTYVANTDQSYEELGRLLGDEAYFKKGFMPTVGDIRYGANMAYCEKDRELVNLTEYDKQKQLFLDTCERLKS